MSLARSETHTRLATARPGSGLGQNPKGPPGLHPATPAQALRSSSTTGACLQERGGQRRNSQQWGGGNPITLLSTWIQPHLTPTPFFPGS